CQKPKTTVEVLSPAAGEALWSEVESSEAVGQPVISKIEEGNVVSFTCTQAYSTRRRGGGGGTTVTVCGGGCQLKAGGTFGACVSSGCMPNGKSCTPLSCSGSCTVSHGC